MFLEYHRLEKNMRNEHVSCSLRGINCWIRCGCGTRTQLEADPVGASAPREALIDAQRGVAGCEIWHSWPEELK